MPVETTRETSRQALGALPPAPVPQPPSDEIDLREVFIALRRRWKLVGLVALAVFSLVAFTTLRQKKVYEASAKIVVAEKPGGNVQTGSILNGMLAIRGGTAETQVEIINSPELIRKAYNDFPVEERVKAFGTMEVPKWSYQIRALKDTDVILVTAKSYNPEAAARFANSIAQTYLELDLRRNSQATRQGREYVERERSRTQSELAAASASLAAYKQASGMIAPSAQVNEVAAASARLRNELHAARAEDKAARLKLADLTAQLRSTASEVDYQRTVAENPEYATVRASILELQKELAKVSQVFAPGSPERTDVENQIEAAEKRLERLSAKTVSGQTTQRNPVLVQLQTQYSATKADAIVAAAKKSAVEAQARSVSQELMKYPEQERRFAELQQRVDVLKSTYEMLSQRYYSLLIEERSSLPGGMIAAQAEANFEPSSPNVKRNLILGLFLALVFGVAAGLVSDHLDNKIHRAEDIERLTGLATLALVPEVESPNTEDGNLYVGKAAPQHAFLEAFRMLRNNIGFSMPDRSLKTIAVTSSTMGEGKSTVASNLAIAMAMDRKRVLLVDADLRKPTVHTKMHVSKELGLSSVISGTASLAEAIRSTEWDGLDCLPAGPLPPDPTEFLNSARCRQVLSEAQGQYDYIVLDAPPCIGISDMQVISTLADGVAIVVALDQATKPQLLMSYRMIQQSGAKVIGSAVNRVSLRSHGYYGYYGYYGYGDGENVGTSAGRSKHS